MDGIIFLTLFSFSRIYQASVQENHKHSPCQNHLTIQLVFANLQLLPRHISTSVTQNLPNLCVIFIKPVLHNLTSFLPVLMENLTSILLPKDFKPARDMKFYHIPCIADFKPEDLPSNCIKNNTTTLSGNLLCLTFRLQTTSSIFSIFSIFQVRTITKEFQKRSFQRYFHFTNTSHHNANCLINIHKLEWANVVGMSRCNPIW